LGGRLFVLRRPVKRAAGWLPDANAGIAVAGNARVYVAVALEERRRPARAERAMRPLFAAQPPR